MSTEIKGVLGDGPFILRPGRWEGVVIEGRGIVLHDEFVKVNLDRASLIAAVAKELDVIVIERSELPEVEPRTPYRGYVVGDQDMANCRADWTAAEVRDLAIRWLALAEHLDAHPPVDEAQVEALTKALIDAGMDDVDGPVPAEVARRMAANGVRIEALP